MALSTCKGGKSITDFCHREISEIKDGVDDLVIGEIRFVGKIQLGIICKYCRKPTIYSYDYFRFCSWCEKYYYICPNDSKSESCNACKDVL